jgi:hypothetical protein
VPGLCLSTHECNLACPPVSPHSRERCPLGKLKRKARGQDTASGRRLTAPSLGQRDSFTVFLRRACAKSFNCWIKGRGGTREGEEGVLTSTELSIWSFFSLLVQRQNARSENERLAGEAPRAVSVWRRHGLLCWAICSHGLLFPA